MSKAIYVVTSQRETDIEQLRKALLVYIITKGTPELFPAELSLMVYYLKYGYSEDTKERYSEFQNKKKGYVNVLTTKLRGKGYLLVENRFKTVTKLSPDMEFLRNTSKAGFDNLLVKFYDKE